MSDLLTFSITLRPEPEGGFTVRVPALPEIVTYGRSEDEALAMAKDAIGLVLQSRKERGEPIRHDVSGWVARPDDEGRCCRLPTPLRALKGLRDWSALARLGCFGNNLL
jgi:predicted RNase H-like HicB family nuclease